MFDTNMVLDVSIIVIIVGLLFVNAIVSGFEIAFFSLKKEELQKSHNHSDSRALKISKLLQNPEKLLSTLLVTGTTVKVFIVILASFLVINLQTELWATLAIIVLIGLLIIIPGDIVSKAYASQKSLQFVRRNVSLVEFLNRIMSPFSYVLTKMIKLFSRLTIEKKYDISLEELSKALELTSDDNNRDNDLEMLEGIIRFRNKTAEDIMVSRSDMVSIDIASNFKDVVTYIVAAGFSRIPVYEENQDNIKGILYVKDLLPNLDKKDNFRWQSLIRSAYFVPGTKRIDDLLEEFRANKNHMAILIDEYGGTMGIVTMEDILEEIVGEISDEYDEDEQPLYYIAPDGSYVFDGKTSLEDFISITNVAERDFEKIVDVADTIAGLMLEVKGDFPARKEIVEYMGYSFQAEEVSNRRILKVRFFRPKD